MIYKKGSNDYISQIIAQLADISDTGYYSSRYLNCWGENSNNEDFYSIAFHLIDYIRSAGHGIEIKHIHSKPVFIKNPRISVTKGKISCASCMYACQTEYIPAEYRDDDPQHRGFCMMIGRNFYDIYYGIPCKHYQKGDNNIHSEWDI